ncbi:MAG: histidinol-phosphate transaminase [Chloroflexi bacterium]|nr:histidinol-phosphate transaminase [Chloroflexota bacterium]
MKTSPQLNPHLLQVPLYTPGRSVEEVMSELGLETVTKMASNESPVGSSTLALTAAHEMLGKAHRYPGQLDQRLRQKLARRLGHSLTEHNIVLANGGTNALHMLTQAFVFDGGNSVMSRVTFPLYNIFTLTFGGQSRQVKPTPTYEHDLQSMLAHIDDDTRLIYLCSPNNPSGHIISQMAADDFLAQVPSHVVVIFDEAYFDYVTDSEYPDTLEYVTAARNVLILRTFSKSAGLANMRIGYLIGPRQLTDYVRRAQLPFHVNEISLAAAYASLDDESYHKKHRQTVLDGRDFLYTQLSALGLSCLSSQANFVTIVDPPLPVPELVDSLLRRGVIVRGMGGFGLPNGVRVSVGSTAANQKFIEAMKAILGD